MLGVHPEEIRFEYVGVNALHGRTAPQPDYEMNEVGLRIAADRLAHWQGVGAQLSPTVARLVANQQPAA